MPMISATFLEIATYSSGDTSLDKGISSLNLGDASECLCVACKIAAESNSIQKSSHKLI